MDIHKQKFEIIFKSKELYEKANYRLSAWKKLSQEEKDTREGELQELLEYYSDHLQEMEI